MTYCCGRYYLTEMMLLKGLSPKDPKQGEQKQTNILQNSSQKLVHLIILMRY